MHFARILALTVLTALVPHTPVAAHSGGLNAEGCHNERTGDPGYGRHLDRDGDGVGCE